MPRIGAGDLGFMRSHGFSPPQPIDLLPCYLSSPMSVLNHLPNTLATYMRILVIMKTTKFAANVHRRVQELNECDYLLECAHLAKNFFQEIAYPNH